MRRVVIGLIILMVLVGSGYLAYQRFLAPQPDSENVATDVNAVVIDTGVDVVSAEGQIMPLRQAMLSFPVGGRVEEILVAEGDMVGKGDPLIRLEATDLEIALSQAQIGLAQAEANLETASAGLLAAQANWASAQIGVEAAEVQLALVQAAPSTEEIAVNESSVAVADAAVIQAIGGRDATLEGATAAQIQAAEAELAAAVAERRPVQEAYSTLVRFEVTGDAEEQLRIQLNAAEASVRAAQAALDELSAGATEAERQAANAGVAVAVAQRDAAQAQLDLLLTGAKPEQVTVAEVRVEQARAAVVQAELVVAQAEAAVAQAEAGIAQAQAAVDAAQAMLNRMILRAPFDGTVGNLSVKAGEVVAPSVPVVTLADLSGWHVETTDLTELDVVAVELGDTVDVRVDALPGQVLKGTVTAIADVSTLARGDVTYAVTIKLGDTSDLPLRWGMTVFVDVHVN